MSVSKRKPAKPIHYPPSAPAPRKKHLYAVSGKWASGSPENWGTIAKHYDIGDVWDLILYNFQCRNPEEVNWCMHEFLKCTKSNDGKNFSFSPSDAKPEIYIPPIGFSALSADDVLARELAIKVLSMPEVKKFSFHTPVAKVSSKLYTDVLNHIKSQTIICAGTSTGLPTGVLGQWVGVENVLVVREPAKRSSLKDMVIVHEATHAGLDVQKQSMITLEGEVCGYIAEMCFSILVKKIPMPFNPFAPALRLNPIRQWAAKIAQDVLQHAAKKSSPFIVGYTDSKLNFLEAFIRGDPKHGPEADKDHAADGV
ncbi:MAG TPA: hypothetical protein VK629_12850 [Steroidobacteraceae bacterium]|nr:hypothetical protein [Steroidobacteraceae bacterium]